MSDFLTGLVKGFIKTFIRPRYEKTLLFIEPTKSREDEPFRDELYWKMLALLNQAKVIESYFGVHTCVCGQESDGHDWQLPDGTVTNSLAGHYLLWHRSEVPQVEIEKLKSIPFFNPNF